LDYVAVSPMFATTTKSDIAQPLGLDGGRLIVSRSVHPVIGIGGINRQTVVAAMSTGLNGVAVVSDIMAAPNPDQAARELKSAINNYKSTIK